MKKVNWATWAILILALGAFEFFNYSSTEYTLTGLLGQIKFVGIRWSILLAIAFCGADFAGMSRLFTPVKDQETEKEYWPMFAAWLLAASINAFMTWIGLTEAMLANGIVGNEILSRGFLLHWMPIFVAVLVWIIRVTMIVTLTMASEKLFVMADGKPKMKQDYRPTTSTPFPARPNGNNQPLRKPQTVDVD